MSERLAQAVAAEGLTALRDRIAMALCRSERPLLRCEDCKRLRTPCYTRQEERARVVLNELLSDTQ